jgi:hypothetical protein
MTRYSDPFLEALMYSHQVSVRGELWPIGAVRGLPLAIVSGSVSADRNAVVRRTAQLTVDPTFAPASIHDALTPYGAQVKIWRGIRYINGAVEEYPIFNGRVESVDNSIDGIAIRCSDAAADIADAKFTTPAEGVAYYGTGTTKVTDEAKKFIQQVIPGATVTIRSTSTAYVSRAMTNDQDRADLITTLVSAAGAEWYADPTGIFYIDPLPAIISPDTLPVWIVDSGDVGVTVDRAATMDRQGVYNQVVVDGEAVGGTQGAHNFWHVPGQGEPEFDPDNPMYYGGPFGKVTGFFTGQPVNSTQAALDLAKVLCLNSIAKTRSIQVTCVPNPKLRLGEVVRVYGLSEGIDGMYYVQQFEMPLGPDDAMTMSLNESVELTPASYRMADRRIPEGASWP